MAAEFRLRGYTVERLLGRGASGEVWRARVGSAGPLVALKRIRTADATARERARSEAALLCALDHPNLVRLHTVVPAADELVLVIDLADGGSLADLLAARGRLTAGEAITAVAPVAAALAYLHGQGVVHGDVSAGNVLFTSAGVPLLADVGVARLVGDDSGAEATPAYVDPVVAAGSVPGPPSDVFMLAGVALHALTGTPPWPAPDPAAALELAARGELDDVAERLADAGVGPVMAAVVGRALNVDPHRRGTAADLALDLRHSGRPLAVELEAGRGRPEPAAWAGPRHAARPGGDDAPGGSPPDASRPAFDRPGDIRPGLEPPTRMVGPRPRPVIPRPPRRRGRLRAGLLVAAALAVVAAGGVVWARAEGFGDGTARRPAADGPAARGAADSRREVKTAGRTSAAPATVSRVTAARTPATAPRTPAQRWQLALRALDAVRARAFAGGDARLFSRVYAAPPLAAADAALLRELVPTGCALRGVRTRYTDVIVTAAAQRATVLATASLPPSQLVCGARVRAVVPGAGPTRLRLELVATRAGPRIARQALVRGQPIATR